LKTATGSSPRRGDFVKVLAHATWGRISGPLHVSG